MDLAASRYIVIEGPIGAGKTSLARELAQRLHADELLEQPDDNPFLARFYDDMARFALPTQLTFLFQRVDQLRGLAQLDLFKRPTIADFLLPIQVGERMGSRLRHIALIALGTALISASVGPPPASSSGRAHRSASPARVWRKNPGFWVRSSRPPVLFCKERSVVVPVTVRRFAPSIVILSSIRPASK